MLQINKQVIRMKVERKLVEKFLYICFLSYKLFFFFCDDCTLSIEKYVI